MAATMRASVLSLVLPPDALELALLEHAQQLGLQRQRQLAHLVEEQGGAVRDLEPSFPHGGAPVNAPFSCPNSSLSISVAAAPHSSP